MQGGWGRPSRLPRRRARQSLVLVVAAVLAIAQLTSTGRAALAAHPCPRLRPGSASLAAHHPCPRPPRGCALRAGGGGAVTNAGPLLVALTRQRGENGKLRRAIAEKLARVGIPSDAVELAEVPLIEHAEGPDYGILEAQLAVWATEATTAGALPDCVALTSPEAAKVFLRAWTSVSGGDLPLPVVSVGEGTTKVLEDAGHAVAFQPSKANAETLAAELPLGALGPHVLYASSAIAPGTLQEGLSSRGFEVSRLRTYTTAAVREPDRAMLELMGRAGVTTFGSPSAVRAWARCTSNRPACACIGGTSQEAAEAESVSFKRIFAPSSPGISGWAEATVAAVRETLEEARQT